MSSQQSGNGKGATYSNNSKNLPLGFNGLVQHNQQQESHVDMGERERANQALQFESSVRKQISDQRAADVQKGDSSSKHSGKKH